MTGIYFLLKAGNVVYIGKTTRYPKRIKQHKDKDFDDHRFIECDLKTLGSYELRWIRLFKPKHNIIGNTTIKNHKLYLLRLPEPTFKALKARAKRDQRSVNGQIIYELDQK